MEAVFAIPIGGGLGWFLGGRLGSETVGLLIGLGFGFATFIVRLTRMRGMVEQEAAEAERRKEEDR
jgi:F0F1-type ATP synthase assembly protein I